MTVTPPPILLYSWDLCMIEGGASEESEHGLITIRIQPDTVGKFAGKFGFNVKGGADQESPVLVSKVTAGSPADTCFPRLNEGDQVLLINGREVSSMTHDQVVNSIKASRECHSGELVLTVKQNVTPFDAGLQEYANSGEARSTFHEPHASFRMEDAEFLIVLSPSSSPKNIDGYSGPTGGLFSTIERATFLRENSASSRKSIHSSLENLFSSLKSSSASVESLNRESRKSSSAHKLKKVPSNGITDRWSTKSAASTSKDEQSCIGSSVDEAWHESLKKLSLDNLDSKSCISDAFDDSGFGKSDEPRTRLSKSGFHAKFTNRDGYENDTSEMCNVHLRPNRFSKVCIERVPSNYHISPQTTILSCPYSPARRWQLEPVSVSTSKQKPNKSVSRSAFDQKRWHSAPVVLPRGNRLQRDERMCASYPSLKNAFATNSCVRFSKEFTSTPRLNPLKRQPPVQRSRQYGRIAVHESNFAFANDDGNRPCRKDLPNFDTSDPTSNISIRVKASRSNFNHAAQEMSSNSNSLSKSILPKSKSAPSSYSNSSITDTPHDFALPIEDQPSSPSPSSSFSRSDNSSTVSISDESTPKKKSPTVKNRMFSNSFPSFPSYKSKSPKTMFNKMKQAFSTRDKTFETEKSFDFEKKESRSWPSERGFQDKKSENYSCFREHNSAPMLSSLRARKNPPRSLDYSLVLNEKEDEHETKHIPAANETKRKVYEGDEGERDVEYVPENGAQASSESFVGAARLPHKLEESMLRLHQDLKSGALVTRFEKRYRINPDLRIDIAKWSCNETRNRYRDISPYDKTRVILRDDGSESPFNDYINASYVDMEILGTQIVNKYIASQGPLNTTCGHFWLMVWQQHCLLLVMLTTCIEQGRTKCHKYWPELNSTAEYGSISVHCDEQKTKSGFIWRQFTIKHKSSEEKRRVQHLQYVTWPDHGVPEQSNDFFTFVQEVRRIRAEEHENKHPVLVHCSAGIGRTGVLILMETSQCLIEANQPIFSEDLVMRMRDQRPMMIQTSGQFRFVCEAIHRVYDEQLIRPLTQDGSR
ncbi:PDZ domain [Trinorchestia longiramus]|nr:PDZ domain [Trinorchestia longiramus]